MVLQAEDRVFKPLLSSDLWVFLNSCTIRFQIYLVLVPLSFSEFVSQITLLVFAFVLLVYADDVFFDKKLQMSINAARGLNPRPFAWEPIDQTT